MLTLVIPVYRNEASLAELLRAVCGVNESLRGELEVVFVVDGSPDRSYEILRRSLAGACFRSKLVLLSRNFGAFYAIRAGLQAGNGQRFAVMAADLQEPPQLVLEMDRELRADTCDVVIAVRQGREDNLRTRLTSGIFWGLYRRFVVPDVPPGGVDIFGCNRQFRDQLLQLEERHSSLIAQMFWLGFRRHFIGYVRQARQQGKSAWTMRKKINYLSDSLFSFTDLPIRLLIRGGGVAALLSGMFAVLVGVLKILGYITIAGYAATIVAIVFFGSMNLFGLGIVGSYAWRTYENTKARPLCVVARQEEFAPAQS